MKNCSFCAMSGKMTREHIVPAYLCEFMRQKENKIVGWNEVALKMIEGEGKVKDVCAECNNGPLSTLDDYSKELLDSSKLLVTNYTKKQISLRYDYDLLLRWLLKISYNSARTDGEHERYFTEYIPYILDGRNQPDKNQIALMAQMAAPEILDDSNVEDEDISYTTSRSRIMNPFMVRICYGQIRGSQGYRLRLVVIGPLVFYILLFSKGITPGIIATEIRRIRKYESKCKLLTRKSKYAALTPGKSTWADFYKHQALRSRDENTQALAYSIKH